MTKKLTCNGIWHPSEVKHHESKHLHKCEWDWKEHVKWKIWKNDISKKTFENWKFLQQDTTADWMEWVMMKHMLYDWDSLAHSQKRNLTSSSIFVTFSLSIQISHLHLSENENKREHKMISSRNELWILFLKSNIKIVTVLKIEIPLAIRLAKMADFVTELEESMRHCKKPSSMASRTPKIENEKIE